MGTNEDSRESAEAQQPNHGEPLPQTSASPPAESSVSDTASTEAGQEPVVPAELATEPPAPPPVTPGKSLQSQPENENLSSPPISPGNSTDARPVQPRLDVTSVDPAAPPATPPPASSLTFDTALARQAKQKKLEARLERVMVLARQKNRITNRDIRELLRVSKVTAMRYARALVGRGLLKKFGRTRAAAYLPAR